LVISGLLALVAAGAGLWYAGGFQPDLSITARKNLGKDMISEEDFNTLITLHSECFDPEKRTYLNRYLTEVKYPDASEKIKAMIHKRVEDFILEGHQKKKDYMRDTQNVAWASLNGDMVGLYNCRTDEELTRGSMMIFNVCVTRKARGQGVGTALMKHAIESCQRPGRDLTLTVYEDNAPAISLYKKLGFKVVTPDRQPDDPYMSYSKLLMKYSPGAASR